MDGNKDDALKCFRIAKGAVEAGDRTRAQKFLTKARRLDPTLPIDELLFSIGGNSNSQSNAGGSANGSSGSASDKPSDQPSLQQTVPATGSVSSKPSAASAYTEEQIEIVRQIKKKKDYYEILSIKKSCTVEDVRKAYRKLSLKVHPDKNKAPGAEEAFKSVSKAFQCLSNAESKRKYDLSGSDEPVYERGASNHTTARGFNGFYDGDVDADEIFRNFFYGGMGPATQFRGFSFGHQGMGQRGGDHGSSGSGIRTLIQLLPVLLILLVQFMPSSEPVYALSRSYPYEYRFSTEKGVNYYVRSTKFEQEYPPGSSERGTLEQKVEREYFNILSQNCRLELQRRQWGFIRETPHCDRLQQFQTAA